MFVATDATKLPPTGPEAAGSLMTVFEVLTKQQKDRTAPGNNYHCKK